MLSVLIPAYNNRETLLRLLNSITKQSIFNDVEIIVSDDNSIPPLDSFPDLAKISNELGIHWYYQNKNLGVLGNGKFLANVANFKYAVFAQHDDYYDDNEFFKRSINLIESNNLGFVFANAVFEDTKKPFMKGSSGIEILDGVIFSRIFWRKLMTSWSSVIFDNDALKEMGGFGGEYVINELEGLKFSAYTQEEGMAFLYLLSLKKDWALDWSPVSVRGLPESRFSISLEHPGRSLKNDCLVFIYWKVASICENYGVRGRVVAKNIRLVATRFGLSCLNSEIKSFFGSSFYARSYMAFLLVMNRYGKLCHQKNVIRGKLKRYILSTLNK